MREVTADMFVSLDGFTADVEGRQDWMFTFAGPEFGTFVGEVLGEPQLLVMGRTTYEIMANAWPHADAPQAPAMNSLPKLVFSRSLRGPLTWQNAQLATSDLRAEIGALREQDGDPIRSIGSVSLVKAMWEARLVDRLRLIVFPIVLGTAGAKPMFDGWGTATLRLSRSRTHDETVVVLEYLPVR